MHSALLQSDNPVLLPYPLRKLTDKRIQRIVGFELSNHQHQRNRLLSRRAPQPLQIIQSERSIRRGISADEMVQGFNIPAPVRQNSRQRFNICPDHLTASHVRKFPRHSVLQISRISRNQNHTIVLCKNKKNGQLRVRFFENYEKVALH